MAKRKRRSRSDALPKGAYRLPNGDYVVTGPWGPPSKRGRHIRVRAVHRAEPDAEKVAAAVLAVVTQELQERDQRKATDRPTSHR